MDSAGGRHYLAADSARANRTEERNSMETTEQKGAGLGRLQLLAQVAKALEDQWHQRVMAAEDTMTDDDGELLFCDDMLADAQDWSQACSWVLAEAHAELTVGGPGRFCELGSTLAEEAAAGAVVEDMLVLIWAIVGEPPEEAVGSRVGSEALEADEADVETVTEEADAGAEGVKADVEGTVEEAEAEAVAGSQVAAGSRIGSEAAIQADAEAATGGVLDDLVDSVREVLGEPMKLDAKEMVEDRLAWQRPGLGQEG
eukprot:SAG31_NODE_13747_length_849_cov_2.341333_1_plen_256_part_01